MPLPLLVLALVALGRPDYGSPGESLAAAADAKGTPLNAGRLPASTLSGSRNRRELRSVVVATWQRGRGSALRVA